MKEFDLEAAKSGKSVQTRGGRKVKLICFDIKCDYPLAGLIDNGVENEILGSFTFEGIFSIRANNHANDLVMSPVKKECWINFYGFGGGLREYKSKLAADDVALDSRISCIHHTWVE